MPLIRSIGRPSRETRILVALIYALLIGGGVTMVYPFLIMISGSFKSDVDIRTYDVVPEFFHSDLVLYQKYVESRYNESVVSYNVNARQDVFSFKHVVLPPSFPETRVADYREFLDREALAPAWTVLGHSVSVGNRMLPEMMRGYRTFMEETCGGSLAEFQRRFSPLVSSWMGVSFPNQDPAARAFKLTDSSLHRAQMEFKVHAPRRHLIPVSLDGKYTRQFLQLKYGKGIADLNRAHGTSYASYDEVFLSRTVPPAGRERADWIEFVRKEVNVQFLRVSPRAKGQFSRFLNGRYAGDLKVLNRTYGSRYGGFTAVPYPKDLVSTSSRLVDWELFVQEVSPAFISIVSPEFRWRDFLKEKYAGEIERLNVAHKAGYRSFEKTPMPVAEADLAEVRDNSGAIRWEFITRNYRHVNQFLLRHGRGMFNTFVFCALAVLSALIVNPLAAYAMSRFALPSSYKILLFLLATMAFPPMVTAIPNFLLLKELGMLNTFWALVLPGIVNGYAIFLLKGFFDSQPKEIHESAQIDGAGEWTLFWRFTMSLSKPILAVIALQAFTAAYGAFVFAFIVCQDEKMWTLMVWLYQLQQYSHQSVVFAALLMASIPTLLVFIFCQRLIIRGIVIPVEK